MDAGSGAQTRLIPLHERLQPRSEIPDCESETAIAAKAAPAEDSLRNPQTNGASPLRGTLNATGMTFRPRLRLAAVPCPPGIALRSVRAAARSRPARHAAPGRTARRADRAEEQSPARSDLRP